MSFPCRKFISFDWEWQEKFEPVSSKGQGEAYILFEARVPVWVGSLKPFHHPLGSEFFQESVFPVRTLLPRFQVVFEDCLFQLQGCRVPEDSTRTSPKDQNVWTASMPNLH
jgi:hypothetical protein